MPREGTFWGVLKSHWGHDPADPLAMALYPCWGMQDGEIRLPVPSKHEFKLLEMQPIKLCSVRNKSSFQTDACVT